MLPALTRRIIIFFISSILLFSFAAEKTYAVNERTRCSGQILNLGFPKKLLSFNLLSRPGTCGVKPTKIVMHTTWGIEGAENLWQYFETHPEGRYASTQFVVGRDGEILQMLETLSGKVEIGWAVSYFNDDSISIEIGKNGNFNSKSEVPLKQYESTVKLVQALMKAYNIPVGNIEYAAINKSNNPGAGGPIAKNSQGIFGHYQLSPDDRTDPGQGFLRDFRADMKLRGPATGSVGTTEPGSEDTSGGSSLASSSCTKNADGTIVCRSNCVVTNVGKPTGEATLPSECDLASSSTGSLTTGGGGLPGPCQQPPNYPDNLVGAIAQKWGFTLRALPANQLRWIWEEFWSIDCTGILQDIRGTIIEGTGVDGGISQQLSCPGRGNPNVVFSIYGESATKGLILHELTHVWQICVPRGERNKFDLQPAIGSEGYLTKYSRGQCSLKPGSPLNEDHADTIALYLNPTIGELTCGGGAPNPFSGGRFPLHRNVAQRGAQR